MSTKRSFEKGQSSFLLVVFVLLAIAVIVSANYKITKNYPVQSTSVQGISFPGLVGEPRVVQEAGKSAVVRGSVGALFDKTTSVLIKDNQATISGKPLAILPDQAVRLVQASKVISEVKSFDSGKGSLASLNRIIKLSQKDGVVGYEIKGYKKHVLGVSTGVDVFVSAENGQVLEITQSLLGRVLNKISS